MLCKQTRSRFAPCLACRSGQSVGRSGGSTMPASSRAHSRWSSGDREVGWQYDAGVGSGSVTGGVAEGGRSQAYGTVSRRPSQVLRVLEVLKQVCFRSVFYSRSYLLWPVEPSRELVSLGSIYASQAGLKVVGS